MLQDHHYLEIDRGNSELEHIDIGEDEEKQQEGEDEIQNTHQEGHEMNYGDVLTYSGEVSGFEKEEGQQQTNDQEHQPIKKSPKLIQKHKTVHESKAPQNKTSVSSAPKNNNT